MHDIVHDYYSRQLQHTDGLKTSTLSRHQSDPDGVETSYMRAYPRKFCRATMDCSKGVTAACRLKRQRL